MSPTSEVALSLLPLAVMEERSLLLVSSTLSEFFAPFLKGDTTIGEAPAEALG